MKIIEPSVELWIPEDNISHVAKCARVCYGKDSGNDERLYNALIKNKHWSMFRHETHYIVVPFESDLDDVIDTITEIHGSKPWFDWIQGPNDETIIVVNGNWALDNPATFERLKKYEMNMYEFQDHYLEFPRILNMMRYTFCITTQISTSRELNRVSPNNIAERSTRYVNESEGAICRPHWISQQDYEFYLKTPYMTEYGTPKENAYANYIEYCQDAFSNYKKLLDAGVPREDARGILPLDTATKVVYTYNVEEWKHIINLRYYGTTGRPHPNAKLVVGMIKNQLENANIIESN